MPAARKRPQLKPKSSRSSASRRKTTKRLQISVIGAGRMGTALGRALRRAGHRVQLVVTKHLSTARRAAELIGGGAIPITDRSLVSRVASLAESDLLLISTPDDVLEPVAKRLTDAIYAAQPRPRQTQRFALHTSGALSSDVLAPLKAAGFRVASFHPLVSIADAAASGKAFSNVHICLEGQLPAVQLAKSLARQLGGQSFTIASDAKPLYHAAATISSSHVVALFDLAIEMLMTCGLSKQQARQILTPLVKSTADNLGSVSPARALTGPLARGDIATTRKHLAAMKARKLDEAATLYSALGLRALQLARTTNRDRNSLDEIRKLLSR